MTNDEQRAGLNKRMCNNRRSSGLILLIIGGALLLQKMGTPFPDWVFSWPMILIFIGVVGGIRKRFESNVFIVLILVGGFFLLDMFYPDMQARKYTGPVLLIALGVAFILRPRHRAFGSKWGRWNDYQNNNTGNGNGPNPGGNSGEDFLDITSILGGTKRSVLSKDFKGGDITSFLGGTELNLSQADIQGRVVLDITSILGGTKLIVPSNWDIQSELVTVFGSMEDKRQNMVAVDPGKVLLLKGTSFMGGIEIRSY